MKKYVVLQKTVGETPLECAEAWRSTQANYTDTPLAYAGRLDPMASGSLLVLIGDECKKQRSYHNLDKSYTVQIVLGVRTDTGDVLGIPDFSTPLPLQITRAQVSRALTRCTGAVEFPYPHYSSKTVHGKPLHTWALENRLDEIEIPTKQSTIYTNQLRAYSTITADTLYAYVTQKIESIPPVADTRKAIGNDFRRPDIRNAWKRWYQQYASDTAFPYVTIDCVVSSGTYMRTLAEVLAHELGTEGMALHIHRNAIGRYRPIYKNYGIWTKRFR